jgi:hypothetical protein
MDRFEYHCPIHGRVAWHRRSSKRPRKIPDFCPKLGEDGQVCREVLFFQLWSVSTTAPAEDPSGEMEVVS